MDFGAVWAKASEDLGKNFKFDPAQLLELQQGYLKEVSELWAQGFQASAEPVKDRRFASSAWSSPILRGVFFLIFKMK